MSASQRPIYIRISLPNPDVPLAWLLTYSQASVFVNAHWQHPRALQHSYIAIYWVTRKDCGLFLSNAGSVGGFVLLLNQCVV